MSTLSLLPNKSGRKPGNRARIEELAILPIFLKLRGKKALVAGGTEAAAWKAELLAASGAHVDVYAPVLGEAFETLRAATPQSYTHHADLWTNARFAGCAIAICDAENEAEASAFFAAAKQCGVPVNIIDKPDFCTFQFGSIVNRSPAIIAISTDGAAPILGQAIRAKIETLLPHSLAAWAKLAAKLRHTIHTQLASAHQRRAFWAHLAKRAFGPAPQPDAAQQLRAHATKLKHANVPQSGKVTFVGAGPGDAELLTLKAVRALQSADIILFDNIVSDQVLELARREAKRLLVGENDQTMVALAKSGKHVVRLMAGDAADSAQKLATQFLLAKRHIHYETVPGIALALPSGQNIAKTIDKNISRSG